MQRNNTPILIGTIIFGLLALGATIFILMRPASPPPGPDQNLPAPTPTPSSVFVASADIPPRTVVTPDMIKETTSKPGQSLDGAIHSTDEIDGKITNAPIHQGELLSVNSFTDPLKRVVNANFLIPAGFRAVAIWVDPDQTAAGLVDVGDHVDVIATHRLAFDKGPDEYVIGALQFTAGRMIAQNLQVLAVDRSIYAPAPTPTPEPGAAASAPLAAPTPTPVPAGPHKTRVILAAPPTVATDLIAAEDQGTLNLIIRNPEETGSDVPVPQQNEFPSKIVVRYDKTKEGGGGSLPAMPQPTFPPLQPINPGTMPTAEPTGPPTTEVTVIRSTEKTRAVVPE